MPVGSTNDAQKAARGMLLDVIREEASRGTLSSTSEMMGYYLSGVSTGEKYFKADSELPKRRLVAPEFLSGLLTDHSV